jgi:hypothetical protein
VSQRLKQAFLHEFIRVILSRFIGTQQLCDGRSFKHIQIQLTQEIVQRMRQVQFLFGNGDQHISGNGTPNLRLQRVLAGAKEILDAQVLLDPFEEQKWFEESEQRDK